jgi:hypothetical protein
MWRRCFWLVFYFAFLILPLWANSGLTINQVAAKQVNVGEPVSFTLSIVETDKGQIFYSAAGLPTNAALNPNTGYFNWIPDASQAGTHTFTFIAANNGTPNLTSTETVAIQVNADTGVLRITDIPLAFPSPYSSSSGGNITLQYSLSKDADIDLMIISSSGQRIKKFTVYKGDEGGRAGLNKLIWDAKTDFGTMPSSGIYLGVVFDRTTQNVLGKIKVTIL